MDIHLKKINDVIVKPIPIKKIEKDNIKGYDMFNEIYCNVFICAKKKSGKTSTIFQIIKDCSNKDTTVIIFSSTVYKDKNMIGICDWLEKKEMNFEIFTEINDYLKTLLDEIENNNDDEIENQDENQNEIEEKPKVISFIETETEIKLKIKKRKLKKIAPKYIFIFDDISTDLKSPLISKLVKQNRHYKSKVIISSQYPLDLHPQCRRQIDYWLLFSGHDKEKLKIIYSDADLNINFDLFLKIYHDSTEQKYHFLYIDTNNSEFRKDFNFKFVINDN